jgi:hypothetical protein
VIGSASYTARATALAALATLAVGCQQVAWYDPAPGQGAVVTNGRRLGVAYRISDDRKAGQSYVVFNVKHAFTIEPRRGERHAIVRVEAVLVNRAPVSARLECQRTTLEIAGRAFRPIKVRRVGWYGGLDRNEVASGSYARFDLYYDLGGYRPNWEYAPAPPIIGGIPLNTLRAFTVNWRAMWGREVRTGSTRFVLDYTALYASGAVDGTDRYANHRGRTVWGLPNKDRRLLLGY